MAARIFRRRKAKRIRSAEKAPKGRERLFGINTVLLSAALLLNSMGAGAWAAGLPSQSDFTAASHNASQGPTYTAQGNTGTVNYFNASKALFTWGNLGIGLGQALNFTGGRQSAILVNKVIGSSASVFEGSMSAPPNATIVITNPNGITVDSGSNFTGVSKLLLTDKTFSSDSISSFSNLGDVKSLLSGGGGGITINAPLGTAAGGELHLVSSGGLYNRTYDNSRQISTGSLYVDAGGAINLDTNVTVISATSNNAGNIVIANTGALSGKTANPGGDHVFIITEDGVPTMWGNGSTYIEFDPSGMKLKDGSGRTAFELGSNGAAFFVPFAVDAPAMFNSDITVGGLAMLNGGIDVNSGSFTVMPDGTTQTAGGLSIGGALDVAGNATIAGLAKLDGGIDVNNGVFIVDALSGMTQTAGDLIVGGNAGIVGNLDVLGNVGVSGDATVTGLAKLNGGVDVNGGSFTVAPDGTTQIAGSISAGGNLYVAGDAAVAGLSNLDGGINVNNGTFTVEPVTGTTQTAGDLIVGGNAGVVGNLDVLGDATVAGVARLNGGIDVNNGNFMVGPDGTAQLAGDLTVGGSAGIAGSLTVLGDAGIGGVVNSVISNTSTVEAGGAAGTISGDIAKVAVNTADIAAEIARATSSENTLLAAAAADATAKADAAQTNAIAVAATDAAAKATAAQTNAIAAAATDATTKANAAESSAKTYTDSVLGLKGNAPVHTSTNTVDSRISQIESNLTKVRDSQGIGGFFQGILQFFSGK